ncbi:DUF2767 domain-containing protein [Edwardsiella ictaluri]|uniref:Fumarase D n=2 Tax=Edwardsiella ictaluri TaxID=67780 RepID=C5BE11_EDWI9|nr:DUF2767 family protein [Edwardsiella ictaluri]ACR68931.1 hypothetical protein NT01EI_1752 [Edwardsiella ictaluri 93-146]ARD38328.1 DUF2767 domain-containing protein [Edwardsiella ictaluri]AVZ83938.1 DUF2767 domain-containing protein [Edwardsiella ictaluri]EKS7764359.1 DUF2767 family protein [Edwardsiella ictaluri]EKS7771256.1 DUF2767 family protein [Edwardsiella ictaluri]
MKDALLFNEACQLIGLAVIRLHQHGLEVNSGNILAHLQAHASMAEHELRQKQIAETAIDILGDL